MNLSRRQSGFAYIAAVVLLIVVAGVCTALLRLSGTQQATVNQGLMGARANLAARGAIEWGFYQLRGGECFAEQTLNGFNADSGFVVRVQCTRIPFNEGESSPGVAIAKNIYQISAVACNAATCGTADPTVLSRPDYVERRRVATTCMVAANPAVDC